MKDTETILEELGFRNKWDNYKFPYGEYRNETDTAKILLKGDEIYAFRIGSRNGEDIAEMYLNFIPGEETLKYLIRRSLCLNIDI